MSCVIKFIVCSWWDEVILSQYFYLQRLLLSSDNNIEMVVNEIIFNTDI